MDSREFLKHLERDVFFNALDELDGPVARMRDVLAECADDVGGIPLPVPGIGLALHPAFAHARELADIFERPQEASPEPADLFRRNIFWSHRRQGYVHIWSEGGMLGHGGTLKWTLLKGLNRLEMDMRTLHVSSVWGGRPEWKANEKLSTLIGLHRFKGYAMCGMFDEVSKRSGVRYVFRRLRPTIAISNRTGQDRVLACLCLHPIGYYRGSFAGAMVPTDDVIAHLLMMRTDEGEFWRAANHHAPDRAEAGL